MRGYAAILALLPLSLAAQTLPPSPIHSTLPVEPPLIQNIRTPKHAVFLASLGAPMVKKAAVTPAAVAPPQWFLEWDYPPDWISSVVFEVWKTNDLKTWSEFVETAVTKIPMDTSGAMGFYIVRARDLTTGLVSIWNQ